MIPTVMMARDLHCNNLVISVAVSVSAFHFLSSFFFFLVFQNFGNRNKNRKLFYFGLLFSKD
jgi:hypothetical protein